MSEMKPCPFCGESEGLAVEVCGDAWVKCMRCLATGPYLCRITEDRTEEGAVAAWNRRGGDHAKGE